MLYHKKKQNNYSNSCVQYMTKIVNPTAGIGDQLASWITGYYYAAKFQLDYAYSPLFPENWNSFLGFEENVQKAEDLLKNQGYKRIWLPYFEERDEQEIKMIQGIIKSYVGQKVVFYVEISQVYGEQFGVMEDIRRKFNAAAVRRQDKLVYSENILNIAVHVRRGDIVQGQTDNNPQLTMRWLDNNYYVNILNQLLNFLQNTKYKIFIFSQGIKDDFKEFSEFKDIEFCLDMSAMESFLHLIRADILITSKSSFSYKPALLSEGLHICPRNFWHGYPEDFNWILADDYGMIDEKEYRKLKEYVFEN